MSAVPFFSLGDPYSAPYGQTFLNSESRVWILLALMSHLFCMEYIKTNPTSESKMYKFQRLISIVQETDPVGADPSHEFYLTLWI